MKSVCLVALVGILCSLRLCYGQGSQNMQVMLADVIEASGRPSSVIAKLCWTPSKIIQLHTHLTNKYIQFSANDVVKTDNSEFYDEEQHIVFMADLDCPDIATYFEKNSARNVFRAPFRWILFGNSSTNDDDIVPRAISNIDVLLDSEVLVLRSVDDVYEMHFIYKISPNNTWQTEFYGTWNAKHRFQKSPRFFEPTSLRRLDIDGYEISICYVLTNNESVNHLSDGL